MDRKTIEYFLETESRLTADEKLKKRLALPEDTYLLDDGAVLCYPRTRGETRYPYSCDGMTLWAQESGNMSLNESTFYCLLPSSEGKEPYVGFFGGLKRDDGGFLPVSMTAVSKQPTDRFRRFTVYTPQAVYYFTQTPDVVFVLRAFVSEDKKACFSLTALNRGKETKEIYLSAFFNGLFMHQAGESVETKWFKKCVTTEKGFLFESVEDIDRTTHLENFGVLNRAVQGDVLYRESTSSRADFCGGKNNSLVSSTSLFDGHFKKKKQICTFTDTAAAGDIIAFSLPTDGTAQAEYVLHALFDRDEALRETHGDVTGYADGCVLRATAADQRKQDAPTMLKMTFGKSKDGVLSGELLTKFVRSVQRQTEFAALAKNSGVSLLGVRDVAQQLEAALMWNPVACRAKIREMLSFCDPSGRMPRQYSLPAEQGALPQMDTRAFIDQGVWVIDTVHTYLAFTDDLSLLDEICGYYRIVGRNAVENVAEKDSVFAHLTKITDYLINNMDERTDCLHALYGDWNDALDGLGVSRDPAREYGTGVSVMASLQLYKSLNEMSDILAAYGDPYRQKERYENAKKRLRHGLTEFAVERQGDERKILHGWGDERSYKVGSFCDVDGKSRDGLAANAFWIISDAIRFDVSLKKDILRAYERLDGKYGLQTFQPYFEKGVKGVGRIVNLPKGTAENGATYVHATLFGIWSLFLLGEDRLAWRQLYKILPPTHDFLSTTPFVMSNSYVYNEELQLDGESMSDWFTGSANVLLKVLVRCVFGVNVTPDGVTICPAAYLPFESASLRICVKGKILDIFCRSGQGKTEMLFNGDPVATRRNDLRQTEEIFLTTAQLQEENTVIVSLR